MSWALCRSELVITQASCRDRPELYEGAWENLGVHHPELAGREGERGAGRERESRWGYRRVPVEIRM